MDSTYGKWKMSDFTKNQQVEIEEGIRLGLDVDIYAIPEFLAIQMYQIRLGMMEKLAVEKYAKPAYDWFQMEEIRKGLQSGLEVEKYADTSVPYEVMRQIRKGLKQGYDLSAGIKLPAETLRQLRKALSAGVNLKEYILAGYDGEQLREIRVALQRGIEIDPYLSLDYRNVSIREIRLGLERNLDVSLYAKPEFNWRQMREIRLGLEQRMDVGVYNKPLYDWQQMQEIRLGMETGVDISAYSSLMNTAKEMQKKRRLLLQTGRVAPINRERMAAKKDALFVLISEDEMGAMVMLQEDVSGYTREDILQALAENGVVNGIDEGAIDTLLSGNASDNTIRAAHGCLPSKGRDGWYEYFFRTDVKKKPKLLEDGSVDYLNMDWFEIVQKNQRIAFYHEAETGKEGITVTGKKVPGIKGKEEKHLTGRGFRLLADRKTYIADIDGKIELKQERLEISELLIVESATLSTGNIHFNGSIYIKGTVGTGIRVHADKDILIDGFVEAAEILAGGDIVMRGGSNSSGQGYIRAGGDVYGNFFEVTRIYAGGNIRANYCLNCELWAEGKIEINGRNGMLAGGNSYAAETIQAQNIGNGAGIMTLIRLGMNDSFFDRENALLEKEKHVWQEMVLLKNAYLSFQKKYSIEERNANPMYLKLENAIYTKELEIGKLLEKKEELQKEKKKFQMAKVVVRGILFEGVTMNINGAVWNSRRVENVVLKKQGNGVGMQRWR